MKNYLNIKVTCLTNLENKDEFHFDYYDKEGNIVGTVAIDERGKLGWAIWNNDYQERILYCVSGILKEKVENTIEYILKGKQNDPVRWDNAQEFIENEKLVVNYLQNDYFKMTFENSARRK